MKPVMIVLGIIFCGLQYKLWFADGNVRKVRQLKQTLTNERFIYKKLVKNNQRLADEVEALKSGKSMLEERARNDLGMIKRNETYYQIVE